MHMTRSLEWATSIGGVNHAVSKKYLQSYLNEYAFRYNRRGQELPMFQPFLAQVARKAG